MMAKPTAPAPSEGAPSGDPWSRRSWWLGLTVWRLGFNPWDTAGWAAWLACELTHPWPIGEAEAPAGSTQLLPGSGDLKEPRPQTLSITEKKELQSPPFQALTSPRNRGTLHPAGEAALGLLHGLETWADLNTEVAPAPEQGPGQEEGLLGMGAPGPAVLVNSSQGLPQST